MRIDAAERFAFSFMYGNTQFCTKTQSTFRTKKVDSSFLVRLHWSIQNSSCTFNVPMFLLSLLIYIFFSNRSLGTFFHVSVSVVPFPFPFPVSGFRIPCFSAAVTFSYWNFFSQQSIEFGGLLSDLPCAQAYSHFLEVQSKFSRYKRRNLWQGFIWRFMFLALKKVRSTAAEL